MFNPRYNEPTPNRINASRLIVGNSENSESNAANIITLRNIKMEGTIVFKYKEMYT